MRWSEFADEPAAVAKFRAALAHGRLHHAWILAGLDLDRAALLAQTFAGALICPSATDEACGSCGPCARIASGTHADLIVASPEGEGSTRVIKVESVRAIVHAVALAPLEGPRKVVVVHDAGQMTRDAQNALLKTLEEPPPSTLLILVVHQIEALLPTIRSRCLKVTMKLRPLGYDEQNASLGELFSALQRGAAAALDLAERWAGEKEALPHRLDALAAALAAKAENDERSGRDQPKAIECLTAVSTARRALRGYANPRLTLDWLFMKLHAEGVR